MTVKRTELDVKLDRYSEAAQTTRAKGKLKDWAVFTAAAGAALTAAESADAAPVFSGTQNIMLTRTTTSGSSSVLLDLNGDSQDDFRVRLAYGSSGGLAEIYGFFNGDFNGILSAGGGDAARLPSSVTVSSGAGVFDNFGRMLFSFNGSITGGVWPGGNPTSTSGFAGVEFFDTSGDLHYGWLRLKLRNDAGGIPDKVTVVEWAYESEADTPIHIQPVPEPSSLGLLAMGAAGVAAFRRRKRNDD